jgi:hypothetical protein
MASLAEVIEEAALMELVLAHGCLKTIIIILLINLTHPGLKDNQISRMETGIGKE